MKLTNMELPPKRKKELKEGIPETISTSEKYPYGLRIDLNNDSVKKLGLDPEKMKVGKSVRVTADAEIVGLRVSETSSGGEDKSIDLQITDMAVETGNLGTIKEDMAELKEKRRMT